MVDSETVAGEVLGNPEGVVAGDKEYVEEVQVADSQKKSLEEFLLGFLLKELNSAKVVGPQVVAEGSLSPAKASEDLAEVRTAEEEAVVAGVTPEKLSQSEDTVMVFGGIMSEIMASKKSEETLAALDKALEDAENLKDIVAFDEKAKESTMKDSEGDSDDFQIHEASSAASKKKMSKHTPQRKQPSRAGKRKVGIEEETELNTSKTSAKKPRILKHNVSGKEVLMEMECSAKFLREEGFYAVLELLEFQGWQNLYSEQEQVCHEVVTDFFKNITLENGPIPALNVNFRGNKFRISSGDLSAILDLPHSGYAEFNKGNIWPNVADSKEGTKDL